jgi:signal transduction histidine kinase
MKSILFGRRTWRELLFLISGLPFGTAWFVLVVTAWSLTLGLLVTPLVIPLAMGLGALIRALAALEASLARDALGIRVYAPHHGLRRGGLLRRSFGWLADASMWRAQGYLAYRAVIGFGLGTAMVALLGGSLGAITAPLYYHFIHGGPDVGFTHIDTLPKALLAVPVGLAGFTVTMLLVRPLGSLSRQVALAMLEKTEEPAEISAPEQIERRRRTLAGRGAGYAIASVSMIFVWLLTGHGNFWPVWPILSLMLAFGIAAWRLYVDERPERWQRPGLSPGLAFQLGASALIFLFLTGVWAAGGASNFWPVWPLLGLSVAAAVRSTMLFLAPPDRSELTQRIETLTSTRAGAVDQQEAELRRIERDLHDGAQARLVALGMSIGMAEQKLANDPEGARELLEEARQGASSALKELRDLARGIHPPVLADRGLEAAVTALADASPLRVTVNVDVPRRPAAPVESAAYFVVAEALANASKHAQATRVDIRILRDAGVLTVEVSDDGLGGANDSGSGLRGLRRRVEALDGKLRVASPHGGPTLVRAEMPCGS